MTNYIDHLLYVPVHAGITELWAAGQDYGPSADEEGNYPRLPCWNATGPEGSFLIHPCGVRMTDSTYDEDGELKMSATCALPSWAVFRGQTRSPALEALTYTVQGVTRPYCLMTTDRNLSVQGLPFIYQHQHAPNTTLGQVTPLLAGDNYPMPAANSDDLGPFMITGGGA